MNQRLREAAEAGDIEALYALIPSNPCLLEQMDENKTFVDTPLHVAASAGHTHFAMEMMRLKPSFARKPNHSGFSPMHLALQNGHKSLVRRLVEVDPNLVRVNGRESITPLHYVAEIGDVNLLAEFLVVCPKSIEDLTIRRETALHVAMKNDKFEALEVLVGWLQRRLHGGGQELREKVLNWKDDDGNTVLHIALTTSNRSQFVRKLLSNGADVNSKNSWGWTALDVIEKGQIILHNREILKKTLLHFGGLRTSSLPSVTRVDYFRWRISCFERCLIFILRRKLYISSENRNALLVVAVLMVTSTYQTGINPPGGVWKDNYTPLNYLNTTTTTTTTTMALMNASSAPPPHHVGNTVLTPLEFYVFALYNSAALWSSLAIIFILLPHDHLAYVLLIPLSAFLLCHFFSVYIISGGGSYMYIFFGFTLPNLILTSALILRGRAKARRLRELLLHQTLSK